MQISKKNIWIISLANGLSAFGGSFQFLATSSLTYALTQSPFVTSLQMVVDRIPFVLFGRWAGRIVDRRDPRTVIIVASLLQALLTTCYIIGHKNVAVIMLLNLVVSTFDVFTGPAQSALFPLFVEKHQLIKGNARKSSIMGIVQLFGPATAGWAIVRFGPTWAFVINAVTYLFPAIAMYLIKPVESVEKKRPLKHEETTEGAESFDESFSFLRQRPIFLAVLLGHAGFMLGTGAINSLYYPYTSDVLGRGPEIMGLLTSIYFGASIAAGVIVEFWGNKLRKSRSLFLGYGAGSVIWAGYTFLPSLNAAIALNMVDGMIYSLVTTLVQTQVQEEAPQQILGRLFAIFYTVEGICSIVGMLLGGWTATTWSVIAGFRVCASLSFMLIAAAFLLEQTRVRPNSD